MCLYIKYDQYFHTTCSTAVLHKFSVEFGNLPSIPLVK